MSNMLAGPGWPRPRADYEPRNIPTRAAGRLPVPWVIARTREGGAAWTEFHDEASRAHDNRLCQVCGERMDGVMLLGVSSHSNDVPFTSGPGMHPRCCVLALKFCPHFKEAEQSERPHVYRYDGRGRGYYINTLFPEDPPYTDEGRISPYAVPLSYDEARELARAMPLGIVA